MRCFLKINYLILITFKCLFFFQSESKKQLILNKGEKGRKKEGKREEGEEKGRERGKKNSPISTSE